MPIIDQGYQHWSGELSGHAWRWLTIARHGVRVGMKESKVRLVILVAWVPAVVLAGALCLWGLFERNSQSFRPFAEILNSIGFGPQVLADPKTFRLDFWTICYSKFMATELFVAMILMLLVGRQLISQDLRFNALPLYFSRPLRRSDYFIGKLGVIGGFLGMVIIVPSLIAYVLGMACSLDVTILRDTFPLLLSVIAYGVVIAVSAGTLILALSALSRNSRIVGLFWVGLWFVSSVIASMLNTAYMFEQRRSGEGASSFFAAQLDAKNWRPLLSYTANLSRIGAIVGDRRLLAKTGGSAAARHARDAPVALAGPTISVVLVGRSARRVALDFRLHHALPGSLPGSPQMNPIVSFHEVSKWYGNVIGLNKLSIQVPAGVTGLLGPNGAGKSTLLQLATGQLFPTQGEVRVLGQRVWNNPALNRSIGLCPEQDAFYEWMTGQDFIYTSARLSGMGRAARARPRPARWPRSR